MIPERFKHDKTEIEEQNGVSIVKHKDKEYFSCLGLSSRVIERSREDRHILLADIEDSTLEAVREMADEVFNFYAIIQSSKKNGRKNYHLINPVVRTKQETRSLLQSIAKTYLGDNPYALEDRTHTHIGYLRGDWVLRITKKPSKMKPMIQEARMAVRPDLEHDRPFSAPHLNYLNQIYGIQVEQIMNHEPYSVVGKNLETVKYYTYK